jgi:hypothetical protein
MMKEKKNSPKLFISTILVLLIVTPVCAEETWTDLAIYLFATGIEGDAQVRNVKAEVDIGFDDILDNLDSGLMGYIEHRRGKWSFIGDIAYLDVSADDSTAFDTRIASDEVELDVEFSQPVLEGFVGYRIFERDYGTAGLGLDLLVGARYTELEIEFGSEATRLGPIMSESRDNDKSLDEDWTDAVIGLRLQYGGRKGWGSSFWLDFGDGPDSNSRQFIAGATYRSNSNWHYFGGFRYLNLEYDTGSGTSKFDVDLDYSGPIFGASYRM